MFFVPLRTWAAHVVPFGTVGSYIDFENRLQVPCRKSDRSAHPGGQSELSAKECVVHVNSPRSEASEPGIRIRDEKSLVFISAL